VSSKIGLSYYQTDDVVYLASDLLGKILTTNIGGKLTAGMITETEAYAGVKDRASHAYGGRRTQRTRIMYRKGGYSYVYLCYGIHNLFNIVTSAKEVPHAVLIRGIYPVTGWDTIMKRRNTYNKTSAISDGPGKLTKALGIELTHNGILLDGNLIWLEDWGKKIRGDDILRSKRIGVDYAGEDALLPYRFNLAFEKYL
jgi:DNA-3-methyladenine glycosylase